MPLGVLVLMMFGLRTYLCLGEIEIALDGRVCDCTTEIEDEATRLCVSISIAIIDAGQFLAFLIHKRHDMACTKVAREGSNYCVCCPLARCALVGGVG